MGYRRLIKKYMQHVHDCTGDPWIAGKSCTNLSDRDLDELRSIWSKPDTRKRLLQDLNERGYTSSQLEDLRQMLKAEESDLYDVLAHISFNTKTLKRSRRAESVRSNYDVFESKQRMFLDFVLNQYIETGFTELDETKLPDLLILKYKAIADAKRELGEISDIRSTFIDFQKYLYID